MTPISAKRIHQLCWEDVKEGQEVPRVTMAVPYEKVILNAASTWDFFPGHHNPDYARSQGQKTIYISTLFFQGFVDRVVTDWLGPATFIARRKISMRGSVYAGDTMYGEGRVVRCYTDDAGRPLVDLEVTIGTQDGPQCPAEVTVVLPARNGADGRSGA